MDFDHRYSQKSSNIDHLTENIDVVNTAGGIDPALAMTLQLGRSIKQTTEMNPENG